MPVFATSLNLKFSTGFFAIYSRVLVRGLLWFEFREILAFILFHFESDLLGETFLPNGLTKISLNSVLPVLASSFILFCYLLYFQVYV